MTKKVKVKGPVAPEFPKVFETFTRVGDWEVRRLKQDSPSCFNGAVSVRRYRITIEKIEEPIEVLQARLQELWENCDNHHEWGSLKSEAARLGYELKGQPYLRLPKGQKYT